VVFGVLRYHRPAVAPFVNSRSIMTTTTSTSDVEIQTSAAFEALLEHWADARIDSPLMIIGRFDDAARQLIAVGALIQTAYLAAFGFGSFGKNVPAWVMVLLFVPLLSMLFCAARVICVMPKQLEAFKAYMLMKTLRTGIRESTLSNAIDEW